MNAAKRIGLIVALLLSLPLVMLCARMARALAAKVLVGQHGLLSAAPHLPENLGRALWLGVELLPLLVWRRWRDLGSLRFGWSWTILLALPVLVFNLSGFAGPPVAHPWIGSLDILWLALLTGANEEMIFRGYMFHDRPEVHPKVTILASSVAFALFHYVNLDHDSFYNVTRQVCLAFFMGLGLGTMRLATGSLGWCILLHWMIDAAYDFDVPGSALNFWTCLILVPGWLLLTLVVFGAHPALRRAGVADASFRPAFRRFRWLRWVTAALSGLLGGLAILALVMATLPSDRLHIPAPKREVVSVLGAICALPCLLLAFSVVRWPRWRALPWNRSRESPGQPLAPVPPGRGAVKIGAALLFYVTLLTMLYLALDASVIGFGIPLHPLPSWQILWEKRLSFSLWVSSIVGLPLLALFSLSSSISPRFSWRMAAVWMAAAAYQILLIWVSKSCAAIDYTMFFRLKIYLLHLGIAGLLLSIFLAVLSPLLPRRLG